MYFVLLDFSWYYYSLIKIYINPRMVGILTACNSQWGIGKKCYGILPVMYYNLPPTPQKINVINRYVSSQK